MILFIIPGNPGIGEFYEELQDHLSGERVTTGKRTKRSQKSKYPKPLIHILTYSSFQKKPPKRVNNIREEAFYIQQKMEEILESHPKFTPVIAIGHSIGSWILKEIMLSKPNLVHQAIFLFPFLALDKSNKKQRLIHALLRLPLLDKIVLGTYRILHLLPRSWKKIFISAFIKSMTHRAKDLTLEYFIDLKHIPRSVIHLAKTEFITLPSELSQSELKSLYKFQEKSIYIFNPQDIWAPMSHYLLIRNNLPKARTRVLFDVPHDFCVYHKANEEIAEAILNFLDRL